MQIVLNNFGVSLGRDNEGFVITTQDGRQRIPVIGVTSILVAKGALISTDAMLLAIENEIEVILENEKVHCRGILIPSGMTHTANTDENKVLIFLKIMMNIAVFCSHRCICLCVKAL